MQEREKDLRVATFRFGVIGDFVTGVRLNYGEKERLLAEKTLRQYQIPFSDRTRVARATIEKWILDYKKAGFRLEGLYPRARTDKGSSRSLTSSLKLAIKELKKQDPNLTVPAVIKLLKYKKLVEQDAKLNMSTIYQYLKNEDLVTVNEEAKDKRQFEARHPNELWQSDVMHGPHVVINGKSKKTYLIAIIDDFSRYIINAYFYLDETRESFIDCLRTGIQRRGLPQKLYVDNGSCYRALHLDQVAAQLGIAIHHSRPYTPQGRGKIERWFQYVQVNFLAVFQFDNKKCTFDELQQGLEEWVLDYNNKAHGSTGEIPIKRYQSHIEFVRFAPPDLLNYFREIEYRRVRKDRTVKLRNTSYEVPVGLVDRKIELRFFADDMSQIEVFFENKTFGIAKPVDIHINGQIGRNWDYSPKEKKAEIITCEPNLNTGLLTFAKDEEEQ